VALVKALLGRELSIIEPLESVRDYLHLDDLVRAFEAVIAAPPAAGLCETYNVGSGTGHSIGEVIETVERVSGRLLRRRIEVRPGSRATWNVLDIGRIGEGVGWAPRVSFDDGLRRLWNELASPGTA
jgi:nucleoside-diphosphate-sugar epimerase